MQNCVVHFNSELCKNGPENIPSIKICDLLVKGFKILTWFLIESNSWTGKPTLFIFVQTKKGWLVRLRLGDLCESGETVQNTLRGVGTEQRGGDTKILKRRGASWVKGWCFKKGVRNPLMNYGVASMNCWDKQRYHQPG